jgi:DNA repair exonuclease SbcCD ATPase subunit
MVEVERTKRSNRKNQTSNKISQKPEPAKEEIPLPIPTLKEEAHIIELTEETTTKLNPDPFEKILLLNQTLMETIKTELSSKSPVIQNLTQTLQKTQTDLENTTLELTNEKQQNIALKTKISQLETSQTELLEQCQVLNTSLSRVKEELQTFQSKTEEQAQLITNLTQKEEEYKRQVHPPINQMELSQLENLAKKYVEKLNEIHLAISLQKKVEEEAKLCIICCSQERHYVCVPCGHLVYCENCSILADKSLCPICRAQVSLLTKIFKV